ncbi:uncharacterized protein LOC142360576 isoform X3 [Opisthocomus hoazin]|uniref:uncharacterized protein LOC142360576 isoform X3 n=1 Tax=Opisthocomus hoazin TaxID=30419 RepID=UPI003F530B68
MGRGSGAGFGDSPSTHPVSMLSKGFSSPLAVGESIEGGDGVSGRQPPAQPRLSAAVGCWLFAGRLVLGPLTSPVLSPGSHHVHPTFHVLPETLQGNQELGETRAAPEPTLQPPTPPNATPLHPTPRHAALQCGAAVTDLGLPDPWPDIVLDEQQRVHHHQHDQVIHGCP